MEKHSIISDIDAVPPFSMEKHSLVSNIDPVPTFSIKNHSLISAHLFHRKHRLIRDIDAMRFI